MLSIGFLNPILYSSDHWHRGMHRLLYRYPGHGDFSALIRSEALVSRIQDI